MLLVSFIKVFAQKCKSRPFFSNNKGSVNPISIFSVEKKRPFVRKNAKQISTFGEIRVGGQLGEFALIHSSNCIALVFEDYSLLVGVSYVIDDNCEAYKEQINLKKNPRILKNVEPMKIRKLKGYSFGIIDYLQTWNIDKRLEKAIKSKIVFPANIFCLFFLSLLHFVDLKNVVSHSFD